MGEAIEEDSGSDIELRNMLRPDVNPNEYESKGIDDDELKAPEGDSVSKSDDEMREKMKDISAEVNDLEDLEETRRQETNDEFIIDDNEADGSDDNMSTSASTASTESTDNT